MIIQSRNYSTKCSGLCVMSNFKVEEMCLWINSFFIFSFYKIDANKARI